MTLLRLICVIILIVMFPYLVGAQASVESLPNLETSSTILKPNLFGKFYSYFIFASGGALVIASGIWYSVYSRKHQHPYKFLEITEKTSSKLVDEGNIEAAIEILTLALRTIENDPVKFPTKCQSRNGAIWMLKRKICELNEMPIDI